MGQSASDDVINTPTGAPELGIGKRGLAVESYSTVKSAQRLSATLSMRLNGLMQIIDM